MRSLSTETVPSGIGFSSGPKLQPLRVLQRSEAIRICEAIYKARPCTHVDHLWQGDAEERNLNLIIQADAQKLIRKSISSKMLKESKLLAVLRGAVGGEYGGAARREVNRTTLLARRKKFSIYAGQYF